MQEYACTKICLSKPTKIDQKWGKNATIPNIKSVITMKSTRIMKSAPKFELPHQFFVWVAQKLIVFSDVDLLLIEYYKKRLNPQEKNGKIYTTDHKLTELTKLQLSIN